jgi:hypothetical protein
VVGSRTWNENWTGMAVHGDLLALYRGSRQFPIPGGTQITPPHYEMCRVGADHQITTLWSYVDFPATIANAEGFDIATPTGVLFSTFSIGDSVAEIRELTANRFVRTATLEGLDQVVPDVPNPPPWHHIAPC